MQIPPNQNPYAASQVYQAPAINRVTQIPFPVFAMIMFIVSIVFLLIRFLLVCLGIFGLFLIMNSNDDMEMSILLGFLEVGSGAAMVLFGLIGNGMMLARKHAGILFGWLMVIAVLANIGCGMFQAGSMLGQFEPGSAEFIGAIIGMVIVLIIRFAILIAYVFALFQFNKWCNLHQTTQFKSY